MMLPPADGRPLYRRLLGRLREDIDAGRLRPGDLIPPELEIARRHGISRHTVRQAIVELAREGLLRRERGRGTFVAGRPLVQTLSGFYSFAHEMRDRGLPYRTRVIRRGVVSASAEAAARLRIAPGTAVIELELLRVVEEVPLSLEHAIVAYDRAPSLLHADVTTRSLYDIMAEHHGVNVTFGREELRPVLLDRRQAELLLAPPGSPAFHVDRESLAETVPIEWRRSFVRGDRCLYRVELPVRPSFDAVNE